MGSSMTSQPGPADRDEGPTEPSLSIKQVSRRLNVAYNTIRNAILGGRLTAFRIQGAYRIREEDLAAYLENCRIGPSRPTSQPPAPTATAGGSAFKNLDGERLLDAWRRRGVLADPPRARSARSSSSSRDPSTPPGSPDPAR